jgi:hydrogenase maturation protein HypF
MPRGKRADGEVCESIRVRGLVQGVGFRPTVWRIARSLGLVGGVRNDGDGVLIRVRGEMAEIETLCRRLVEEAPPLSRIDSIARDAADSAATVGDEFVIESSADTAVHTGVVPDAATCPRCLDEVLDPEDRRHRYPFTNCTHCGPRLSIVRAIPYDRANTSMAVFPMCSNCTDEYDAPSDRRFHAQPNACPDCGPRVWLEAAGRASIDVDCRPDEDPIATASRLLADGRILAIKGVGGVHLACDATDARAVAELRRRKGRYAKPLALMARDLGVVRACCELDEQSAALMSAPAAPIVLLPMRAGLMRLARGVAPGQTHLGCHAALQPAASPVAGRLGPAAGHDQRQPQR